MKVKNAKKLGCGLGALIALLVFVLFCALSWITTCGIVYLITLCFGWNFSWGMATGVWLVAFLIKVLFFRSKKD